MIIVTMRNERPTRDTASGMRTELERLDPELGKKFRETHTLFSDIALELRGGTDEQRELANRLDVAFLQMEALEIFLVERARESKP